MVGFCEAQLSAPDRQQYEDESEDGNLQHFARTNAAQVESHQRAMGIVMAMVNVPQGLSFSALTTMSAATPRRMTRIAMTAA